MHAFLAALDRQLTVRGIVGSLIALGVIAVVFDVSGPNIALFAVFFVLMTVINALEETPGVNHRIVSTGMLAVGIVCGIYLTVAESLLVGGALTVIAGWLALDALYDLRHGIDRSDEHHEVNEMDYGEFMLTSQHGSLVVQALRERPMTVPEIAEATDLTESRVEEALSMMEETRVVNRFGNGYTVDERELGATGFVRGIVRRIGRPFGVSGSSR